MGRFLRHGVYTCSYSIIASDDKIHRNRDRKRETQKHRRAKLKQTNFMQTTKVNIQVSKVCHNITNTCTPLLIENETLIAYKQY